MSTIYQGWYREGKALSLAAGQQQLWDGPIGSVDVSEHERLLIFRGPTEDNLAPYIYQGTYPETQFRGLKTGSRKLVKCERVDIGSDALLDLTAVTRWSNGHYDIHHRVPPGEYSGAGRYFPNDRVEVLEFSAQGQVTVYEHGGYGGRYVTLGPGRHNLADYGMANQISSLKYVLDGFQQEGIRFGDVRNKRQVGESVAVSQEAVNSRNNNASVTVQLDRKEAASFSWNWSVTAGITVSASVKASTGALPGGEVTAGIEASLSATTGQERSKSYEQSVGQSFTVELGPNERAKVELLVRHYEADVDVVQTLRNIRTGQTVERTGTVHCRYSEGEARAA